MAGTDPDSNDCRLGFLEGGGEMGAYLRSWDSRTSTLGEAEHWPDPLKTLVALMLISKQPMFLAWGPERLWLYNDAFIPILGKKHPAALGRPAMTVWAEAWEVLEPLFDRVYAGEPISIEDFTLQLDRHGALEESHFEFAYTPARDDRGRVQGLFGSCIETTARVRAERRQALAVREQRRQFQAAPGFIAILRGPEHQFEFVNDAFLALTGARDIIGQSVREALPEIADQGFIELLDGVFASGERYVAHQTRVLLQRSSEGPLEERYLNFIYAPIRDEKSQVSGIFVEGFDATEAFHAQSGLAALNETLEERVRSRTDELAKAQQALVQAQKIEAIGRLTGGVAHDFNNLLMVILGGISMLERRPDPERERRIFEGMRQAAERGASLSRQLLAFSRRQPLQPEPVDLAVQLAAMRDLLDRTLRGDVHVQTELADDLWAILVDPVEFELVMLNLCVNARDAMLHGGTIVIRADNVADAQVAEKAGDFVRLSVEDEGVGMSPELVDRIFEPFFTTKDVGKGSGLGLPQVYGFVKQSGGGIEVDSEEGRGTRITLWLPRTREAVAPASVVSNLASHPSKPRRAGHVLLVEDDLEVAKLVTEMLEELGYQSIHAASAQAALGALANERRLDLVFCDVMMPGAMHGLDLAREVKKRRPTMPVLLTSGYAGSAITQAQDQGITVLPKPYDLETLAAAVEKVLEAASQAPG